MTDREPNESGEYIVIEEVRVGNLIDTRVNIAEFDERNNYWCRARYLK